MKIILVTDDVPARYADCSRDPDVLADGLRGLGHSVSVHPGPAHPGSAHANGPASANGFEADAHVVMSIGLDSPVTAAVLAETLRVPLVMMLPYALLHPGPDMPVGYSRLVCRYLPASCLIVESERERLIVERSGGNPQSVFVVPIGLVLPSTDPTESTPSTPENPRVVFDASNSSGAEQAFVASVVDRLREERRRSVDFVALAAEGGYSMTVDTYRAGDIVVVPGDHGYSTVVALRAMAVGCPLLAIDCPVVHDLVSSIRHGVLAQPGATAEWVDKLDYLLTEKSIRTHLARSARLKAEFDFALPGTLQGLDVRLQAVVSSWNYLPTRPDDCEK